jgi:hypothetical protein
MTVSVTINSEGGIYVNHPSNWVRIKPGHTYSDDNNVHNDMCLAVLNASFALNAPIVQAKCSYDEIDNDVWYRETIDYDGFRYYFQLRNRRSHLCIVVKNASNDAYARLIQHNCTGAAHTLWFYRD